MDFKAIIIKGAEVNLWVWESNMSCLRLIFFFFSENGYSRSDTRSLTESLSAKGIVCFSADTERETNVAAFSRDSELSDTG